MCIYVHIHLGYILDSSWISGRQLKLAGSQRQLLPLVHRWNFPSQWLSQEILHWNNLWGSNWYPKKTGIFHGHWVRHSPGTTFATGLRKPSSPSPDFGARGREPPVVTCMLHVHPPTSVAPRQSIAHELSMLSILEWTFPLCYIQHHSTCCSTRNESWHELHDGLDQSFGFFFIFIWALFNIGHMIFIGWVPSIAYRCHWAFEPHNVPRDAATILRSSWGLGHWPQTFSIMRSISKILLNLENHGKSIIYVFIMAYHGIIYAFMSCFQILPSIPPKNGWLVIGGLNPSEKYESVGET